MNRQLNIRFLGLLLIVGIVLAGGGFLLHYFQTQRNAGYLLGRGERAEAEGDFTTAIDYYGRYLAYRPEDSTARAKYGTLLADRARSGRQKEQALLALERALRDDPENAEARRRAVDLAMEGRRFADARTHLEQLLAANGSNPELHELLGQCSVETGQLPEAAAHYEKAISFGPQRVEAYVRLAAVYEQSKQEGKADAVLDRLVKSNPDSIPARMARVDYNLRMDRLDLAGKDLAVLQAGPGRDDPEVWLRLGSHALKERRYDVAREQFRRGLNSKEIRFPLMLAELELQKGKMEEARKILHDAAKLEITDLRTQWTFADALITVGEAKLAEDRITKLKEARVFKHWTDYLEARLLFLDGNVWNAVEKLEGCRTAFVRDPDQALKTEFRLVACYERMGQTDSQVAALRRALVIDRSSLDARLALADALLKTAEADEAIGLLRADMSRSAEARLRLVNVLISLALRRPADRRDFTEAEIILEGTPEAVQKISTNYVMTRARLELVQGRKEAARKLLVEARDRNPADTSLWINLAAIEDDEPAGAILAEAEKAVGDKVELRLARAGLLARKAGAKPSDLLPLEAGADSLPTADRERFQLGLAEVYRRMDAGRGDAERLYRLVAERRKKDPYVLSQLFEVVSLRGDLDAIAAVADQLNEAENGKGASGRFADAYRLWLVYQQDLKNNKTNAEALAKARSLLEEANKIRPGWHRIPLLQGEIEDRTGNHDAAIEKYQLAIRSGGGYPAVVRRVVELLTTRRRFGEAQEVLDGYRGRVLPDELKRSAAVLSLARSDAPEEAIQLAEEAVKENSKDPRDQLWLARVYWRAGDKRKAEERFRKAIDLDRKAHETWVALIVFLARTDRLPDAKAEIANARTAVPGEKHSLLLAPSYEAVGDRAEAEKAYTALLQSSPGDATIARSVATFFLQGGDVAKAEPLLRQMIASGATEDVRRWARRSLAVALMVSGDYRKGTEALRLLDENLREKPGSPDDLRARALLNAARPGSRRQSIKDLEASFTVRPTPNEEFLLARLYDLEGEWLKARQRLEDLLRRDGVQNPGYTAYFVRKLIDKGDLTAATTWLAQLETQEKEKTLRTVSLQARLLGKQGENERAVKLLKEFARTTLEKKKDPDVLGLVGLLLAELKQKAEAEEVLRQFVSLAGKKNPAAVLILVEFLADQNRVAEALQVCSGVVSQVGPEVTARFTVAALRRGNATPADFARAESLITDAQRAKPDSIDLQLSLADFRDAQGRYNEAAAMYQSILARDTRNVLALNNLAWLRSTHERNGEEALRLINLAIDQVGPVPDLLDTRGVILTALGRDPEAMRDLGESASQEPRATTFYHLAQAQHRAGRLNEARQSFAQALEVAREQNRVLRNDLHALERGMFDELSRTLGK